MRLALGIAVVGTVLLAGCSQKPPIHAVASAKSFAGTWELHSQPKDSSDECPFHDKLELRADGTYTSTWWNSSWGDEQHPDITEGKWMQAQGQVTLKPEKVGGSSRADMKTELTRNVNGANVDPSLDLLFEPIHLTILENGESMRREPTELEKSQHVPDRWTQIYTLKSL